MECTKEMDIAEAIRCNREDGAKRLEKEYKAGLLAFAKRFCADDGDAEELVYRTFAEVVGGIDGYTEKSAFFGWMCKICLNCYANDTRRRASQTVIGMRDLPELPDDGAERIFQAVDAEFLRDAIEGLPPEMKEAVLLRYFMDQPLAKVAKVLSLPIGTVKSRLHYARVLLARRLGANMPRRAIALIAGLCLAAASALAAWAVGSAISSYIAETGGAG